MTMRQEFESHKQGMLNKGASSLSIAEYDLAYRHLNDWAVCRCDGSLALLEAGWCASAS
jgi:hypothetical protein